MIIEDLWEQRSNGDICWKFYGNRPNVNDLPEEGFSGIAKRVMLSDLDANLKDIGLPWAPDFSYSSAIKDYIIDIKNKRAAWVISSPFSKGCTFTRPFARKYNLKFFNEEGNPTTIYESDDSLDIVSLGLEKVHISKEVSSAFFVGGDIRIPNLKKSK